MWLAPLALCERLFELKKPREGGGDGIDEGVPGSLTSSTDRPAWPGFRRGFWQEEKQPLKGNRLTTCAPFRAESYGLETKIRRSTLYSQSLSHALDQYNLSKPMRLTMGSGLDQNGSNTSIHSPGMPRTVALPSRSIVLIALILMQFTLATSCLPCWSSRA
jgi:hypothetical protein